MCKQGIRNAFDESCKSLLNINCIKHYLLGNNLVGEGENFEERINILSELIFKRPDMITWFLAGNNLNKKTIIPIANALENQNQNIFG